MADLLSLPAGGRRLACALALALALSPAGRAAAETFDLAVHAYCFETPITGGPCGFPDQASFEARQIQNIQELNLRWCEHGITFRPAGIDLTQDSDISLVSAANGAIEPKPSTYGGQRVKLLRDTIAAANPTLEHVFVIEGLANTGFAAQPPGTKSYANEYYGLFIAPMFGGGAWAHEMGHHFGLSHTWTGDDPGIDRDQDNLVCTTDDPANLEDFDPGDGDDDDVWASGLRVSHEYCTENFELSPADSDSPKSTWCTINCFVNNGSGTQFLVLPQPPPLANVMGAYGEFCHGPYIKNGTPEFAFCSDQTSLVLSTQSGTPERGLLTPVCVSDGDADCDGICQDDDNCPGVPNTDQNDGDNDLVGDACDNCPGTYNPGQEDAEPDGVGDICDTNDDNDCCPDATDHEDFNPTVVSGHIRGINCSIDEEVRIHASCDDPDNDGLWNCEDDDDDGDGVPDWPVPADGCPLDPNDTTGASCTQFVTCPETVWWLSCQFSGTGCVEFSLKLYELINPAPTTVFISRFDIVNQTLYVQPNQGSSLAETADLFVGGGAPGAGASAATGGAAGAGAAPGVWQLEIWVDDAAGVPVALREVVATYDVSDVAIGALDSGVMLAIVPPDAPGGTMTIESTWAPGLAPGAVPDDADRDGIPGFRDSCTAVANAFQQDGDRDFIGDRCDPDFDNDGRVTNSDRAHLEECLGVDLLAAGPGLFEAIGSPDGYVPSPGGEPDEAILRSRCRDADLSGDGHVDATDLAVLMAAHGGPPGPSGLTMTLLVGIPGLAPLAMAALAVSLAAALLLTRRQRAQQSDRN